MKLKTLRHYQKVLNSNQSLSSKQINHLIDKYSEDLSIHHYLEQDDFVTSSVAIHNLDCDLDNCMMDRNYKKETKIINKNKDFIKKSNLKWFKMIHNHLEPKKANQMFNFSYTYHTPKRADVIKLTKQAIYQQTKMTSQQCARIILNWMETFSDDDYSNDVVKLIKPYATLASNQLNNESAKSPSCDKALEDFVLWYRSLCDNTYVPKHKGVVHDQIPNTKYKSIIDQIKYGHFEDKVETIPARHDEIYIDDIQDFFRPLAYMFASALHTKVKFEYTFFS